VWFVFCIFTANVNKYWARFPWCGNALLACMLTYSVLVASTNNQSDDFGPLFVQLVCFVCHVVPFCLHFQLSAMCIMFVCVCVCLCKPLCCLECLPAFPAIQNLSSCAMYVYWRLVALPTCCAKQNLCNSMMSILPASLLLSARWTEIPIDCCTVSAWKQWQANASSAMLSAYIVSWTQTCFCVFVSCLECCLTSAVLFICKIRRKEQGWKHMSCLWRVIKHARQSAVSVAHAWYCAISTVDCRVKVCSVHMNWTELNRFERVPCSVLNTEVFTEHEQTEHPLSQFHCSQSSWHAWPVNASCNWIDLLQVSSVYVLWTSLKL